MSDTQSEQVEQHVRLLPCKQCGSLPRKLSWSSVTEYYGMNTQYAAIICSEENKEYCPVQVTFHIDTSAPFDHKKIAAVLINTWNALNEN